MNSVLSKGKWVNMFVIPRAEGFGKVMHFLNIRGVLALLVLSTAGYAATFGTVVPVRGTVSDIALDERRGRLYIANLSANRVEVMNTSDRTLGTPLDVSKPPSSVALSADNRYLVVGIDNNF